MAAQALDEQLSHGIDRMLNNANVCRPTRLTLPAPDPGPLSWEVETPPPAYMPPTPPQLPHLNFGGLDLLRDFPQLAAYSTTPISPSPASTPRVPKWCPSIPSLKDMSAAKELPLFFDLSKLPERIHTPPATPLCQELQLWQPPLRPHTHKRSRFFPPRSSSPSPMVKLPATSCVLHESDKGVQVDLPSTSKPTSVPQHPSRCQRSAGLSELEANEKIEASAANLWRILTSNDKPARLAQPDPYIDSFTTKHPQDPLSQPHGIFDTRMEAIGMPAELESEPPHRTLAELGGDQTTYVTAAMNNPHSSHVHANSLTGEGNERAEYPGREIEEHGTVICDSAIVMPVAGEEMYTGLNEMVVDHDYGEDSEKRYWDA